jgi:hypothetical protein
MKTRILRFRLRTLLIAFAMVAIGMTCIIVPARRQATAISAIRAFRADQGYLQKGVLHQPITVSFRHQRRVPGAGEDFSVGRCLRSWFGDDYFGDVVVVQLDGANFHDADMRFLAPLSSLEFLRLERTEITDEGLKAIKPFTQLEFLSLNSTDISDSGLLELVQLANLRRLSLKNCRITDQGIPHLSALGNLRESWLSGTDISDAGFQRLKKALPNCKIQPPQGWEHQRRLP